MSSSSHLHDGVVGFEKKADEYDRARPRYPAAVVTDVLAVTPEPERVLDLAAGTGIFTRVLIAALNEAFPRNDIVVHVVEPVDAMRTKLSQTTDGVAEAMPGTAQDIPVPDGFYDQVWIAQAFHWFANIESLREIRRVLRPGGALVLVWNLEDKTAAPWLGALRDLYEEYDVGVPQYRRGTWKEVWATPEAKELFGDLVQRDYTHSQARSRREIHDLVASKSYVAKHEGLIEKLGPQIDAILNAAFADKQDHDASIDVPYVTSSWRAEAAMYRGCQ
jgi:ubiquinone/menaquinone biosynthesis C-methylase UbiE